MLFFPSLKDLFKTIWLLLLATLWIAFATMMFGFIGWMEAAPMLFPGIFICLTFPVVSTALIHHFLWGEDPAHFGWFPRGASWWEAIWCCLACWAFLIPWGIAVVIVVTVLVNFSAMLIHIFGASPSAMGRNSGHILKELMQSKQFQVFTTICWFYGAAMTFKLQRRSNRSKNGKAPKREPKQ